MALSYSDYLRITQNPRCGITGTTGPRGPTGSTGPAGQPGQNGYSVGANYYFVLSGNVSDTTGNPTPGGISPTPGPTPPPNTSLGILNPPGANTETYYVEELNSSGSSKTNLLISQFTSAPLNIVNIPQGVWTFYLTCYSDDTTPPEIYVKAKMSGGSYFIDTSSHPMQIPAGKSILTIADDLPNDITVSSLSEYLVVEFYVNSLADTKKTQFFVQGDTISYVNTTLSAQSGSTGSTGSTGPIGPTGLPGPVGPAGFGFTGPTGPQAPILGRPIVQFDAGYYDGTGVTYPVPIVFVPAFSSLPVISITCTNKNASGGDNPICSIATGSLTVGGFSVDTRNGGVGVTNIPFHWMAIETTGILVSS